jgi:hypothetical protein
MKELDAFSNALAIQNTTLLYHQMADRLYRWLWNWWIPRGYSKTHGSKCLGWFQSPKRICICHLEEKQSNKSVRQQLFYSIAEVYNYNISAGKSFDFEIRKWIISKMALTAWSILNSNMTPKKDYEFIFSSTLLF